MRADDLETGAATEGFFDADSADAADLATRLDAAAPTPAPAAIDLTHGVPVYDASALGPRLADPSAARALKAEWATTLARGAGIVVLRAAVTDHAALDAGSDAFRRIIAEEKAATGGGADHFAAAGANDRIWNAHQKLCLAAPETFARLFAAPVLSAVCEAWLGPGYQMTAQVNLVRPGGAAQEAHRDYHLGFQTAAAAACFPAHVHRLSAALTLQGAIAHVDMPIESGPTKLLPFSQLWPPGYVAFRRPDVRALFEARCIQLPLSKGDALFFNPALLHAAGDNRSVDIHRMANLLQVSSPFGRAMESLDRAAMATALFPALKALRRDGQLDGTALDAAIAAAAEGYPFPTNLDTDPPVGGLAPESQAALLARAVAEDWTEPAFEAALAAQSERRAP